MKRTQKNFFLKNDKCCYCERPFTVKNFGTKEHIVPKSKGGTDRLSNLRPCCFECNQLKSDLDLNQFKANAWVIIKILNRTFTMNENDLKKIFNNTYTLDVENNFKTQ